MLDKSFISELHPNTLPLVLIYPVYLLSTNPRPKALEIQVFGMCFSTLTLQGYQACLRNQGIYAMQCIVSSEHE